MKLDSFRDNKTGSIRILGDGFSVLVEESGRVKTIGKAEVEQQRDALTVTPPANPDAASPRSKPGRKRGSR